MDLARRLTVLQDEVADYRLMSGQPIPISALKRRGMEFLRSTLNGLKVGKELIKEGMKMKVFDLMEERRIRRCEKARRKRHKKMLEEEEKAKAKEESEKKDAEHATMSSLSSVAAGLGLPLGDLKGDLHTLLSDWGTTDRPPPIQEILKEASLLEEDPGEDNVDDAFELPTLPQKPKTVFDQTFNLEGRDFLRVESFARELFAGFDNGMERSQAAPAWSSATVRGSFLPAMPSQQPAVHLFPSWSEREPLEQPRIVRPAKEDSDSDSDSDEELTRMPQVLRFEPEPRFVGDSGTSSPSQGARGREARSSAFPSFPSVLAQPSSGPATDQVQLREGKFRPPSHMDQIYDYDDFATPEDKASAFRRFAPPAPSPGSHGQLLAKARQRYEQEYAMELEDVDLIRKTVGDVGGVAPMTGPHSPQSISSSSKTAAVSKKREWVKPLPLITEAAGKPIKKWKQAQWKIFGRPPAKILKMKKPTDVAKVLSLKARLHRKRNLGRDLEWDDAKSKWVDWYRRRKHRHWDEVVAAGSAKKEDVDAEWQEREAKKADRLSRLRSRETKAGERVSGRRHAKPRDETAAPEWAQ